MRYPDTLMEQEEQYFEKKILEVQHSYSGEFCPLIGYEKGGCIAFYLPSEDGIAFFERHRKKLSPVEPDALNNLHYPKKKNIVNIRALYNVEEFIWKTRDRWIILHPRYRWILNDPVENVVEAIDTIAGKCSNGKLHLAENFSNEKCRECGKELSREEFTALQTLSSVMKTH